MCLSEVWHLCENLFPQYQQSLLTFSFPSQSIGQIEQLFMKVDCEAVGRITWVSHVV